MDASTRQKLDDFRRALSEAINGSASAARKLDDLRRQGFSLYLLLDGTRESALGDETVPRDRALQLSRSSLPVPVGHGWELAPERGSERGPDRNREADDARPPRRAASEPAFLLSAEDVAVLRAMGIDPTRKTRRRRRDPR